MRGTHDHKQVIYHLPSFPSLCCCCVVACYHTPGCISWGHTLSLQCLHTDSWGWGSHILQLCSHIFWLRCPPAITCVLLRVDGCVIFSACHGEPLFWCLHIPGVCQRLYPVWVSQIAEPLDLHLAQAGSIRGGTHDLRLARQALLGLRALT